MRKCLNCKWIGSESLNTYQNCPLCGDKTREATEEEIKIYNESHNVNKLMDINDDGRVNKEDSSLAGKVLANSRKKRGRKPKK